MDIVDHIVFKFMLIIWMLMIRMVIIQQVFNIYVVIIYIIRQEVNNICFRSAINLIF